MAPTSPLCLKPSPSSSADTGEPICWICILDSNQQASISISCVAPLHLHHQHWARTRSVLNIHANPKAAGVRKGFYDPYSNYGHYGRLACDGISKWHPSFLQLASSLKGCSRRYERFCQKYRHHAKGGAKCQGSRMLKRLVQSSRSNRSKRRVLPGEQQLPFAFNMRLNQIPGKWHQVAVKFRRANGIRDGDRERRCWQLR